ncbi:hypothetical protein [Winogradskyella endarachnes]|uniref:Uncharacterized protein n=1 Tax=Winogradskyella endarachnes TaxID=2681965 RepID=A0A6L6U9V8_9FLAO|nr:hypothetical protein [Winogradskyella endarachnes]MUU77712.1 hypothetical protein [Winogradskyella endarachnes]
MQEIKILLFIVGSFFGFNQGQIISEKTTVTINPSEKNIFILQENLVSIIQQESDSLSVTSELLEISKTDAKWESEFNEYSKKSIEFYTSEDTKTLNAKLALTYATIEDLVAFGINVNAEGEFSMTNFPKFQIETTDGILNDRYWNFKTDQPFTFTLEPLTSLPEKYKTSVKSLYPVWKTINQQ